MNAEQDNLDIPDFLKRTGDKAPAKEAVMATVSTTTSKGKSKSPPVKTPVTKKAKAKETNLDAFGYRVGSLKSKAAAMYASKKGATVDEVKAATNSVQLNLIKDCEGRGFKIKRVKENGSGKRQVTRYFLSK